MLVKSLIITAVFVALGMGSVVSRAEEPIRIGLIEPFSGPVAAIGRDTLETAQYFVEKINNSGGVLGGRMIEVVPLDNAMNAEKTTQMLKKAVDDGIRFIKSGHNSSFAYPSRTCPVPRQSKKSRSTVLKRSARVTGKWCPPEAKRRVRAPGIFFATSRG